MYQGILSLTTTPSPELLALHKKEIGKIDLKSKLEALIFDRHLLQDQMFELRQYARDLKALHLKTKLENKEATRQGASSNLEMERKIGLHIKKSAGKYTEFAHSITRINKDIGNCL